MAENNTKDFYRAIRRINSVLNNTAKEEETNYRTALDVAKYVVNACIAINKPISNCKLQWVLYELYKAAKQRNIDLFYEEFLAYPAGPRISSVYDNFCMWAAMPITIEQTLPDDKKKQIPAEFETLCNLIICATAELSLCDWINGNTTETSAWTKVLNEDPKWFIPERLIKEEIKINPDKYSELLKEVRKYDFL